ncbi:MAG TPA: deoxyguanosinetriphosphate triphosphohydrolase [Kineosporiaceae bacterium]|nr:deoxyguanosinetriphosphate triphosphohydrolase [Kineosporiaceae bacterium]
MAELDQAGAGAPASGSPAPDDTPAHDLYGAEDELRYLPEAVKRGVRGPFARDRARVVHSSALRRLAGKTQVVDPGTDDFVRNRLTHSLEVAQIGRDLALALRCDGDVVEAACLAHDLGHPPFGHTGEAVLDAFAADVGGFEGNAQTLRVLTRLEPKVVDPVTGAPGGLNLTRAVLDACAKYPWPRGAGPAEVPAAKFGVYRDDADVFAWLRAGAPAASWSRRCLEAQVMDFADDVAYSVHDVEDAIVAGHLDPRLLGEPERAEQVAAQACAWYLPSVEPGEVIAALDRLRSLPAWVGDFDGSHRAMAALKDMTSELIGRFTGAVERATRAAFGPGPLVRYGADVVAPHDTLVEIGTLKGVAAVFVMTTAARQPIYVRQRSMLAELAGVLADRAPAALEPAFAVMWAAARDDAARLRVVVDQVASLTDASAVAWHARLTS